MVVIRRTPERVMLSLEFVLDVEGDAAVVEFKMG
jgi:hypothetical protein